MERIHSLSMEEQEDLRIVEHLETEYATLISLLGDNFHSSVIRMAVQIERIAMVLTAMRGLDEALSCMDEDYEAAEMIGNKLLMHIAAAYRMIDGDAQDVVPEIKPLDQRKVLFEQLKEEYSHGDLAEEAKRQGISKRTVERWNLSWIESGLVEKMNHGQYRKVA